MKNKIIPAVLVCYAFAFIAGFFLLACNTQAKMQKGEPFACYEARYFAREKSEAAAVKLADECANAIKRDWCARMLQENPSMFKDFNDCWRQ